MGAGLSVCLEEPTSWCAGMVVVPKKSGDVTGFVLTSNHSMRMFSEKFTPSTWAAEKFADYLIGKLFHIETDHKPLVPILSSKHLDQLPSRVLCFRLRLSRFQFTVSHVPGKELYTADAHSRAPLAQTSPPELERKA